MTPVCVDEETLLAEKARAVAVAVVVAATLSEDEVGPTELSAALADLGITGSARRNIVEQTARARRENVRLRRRESELAALSSSARELAELRDAGAVLDRLVQRAHDMMGSDLTYLSELDPASSELRVRTTSGSVSAKFKKLVVPPGRGLASAIVDSRAPQWSARYGDYRSELHERGVDDAVAAEGIVSLLGVPMLTGNEVLGVLFVANRDEHVFIPEEVALLSALADHASVVLQTARTLRDLRRSEDDARRALDRLTEHLAERDRANIVHQDLVRAVLAGGGFAPVAETLSVALGREVALVDAQGQVISAVGASWRATAPVSGTVAATAVEESRRSGHCVLVEKGLGVRAVCALTAGNHYFGSLLLGEGEFDLGPVDQRTIERAAQVGALLALQQEAVSEAEHRLQSELVGDLLDASTERRADVERRARRLGVVISELDTLLLVDVPGDARAGIARAMSSHLGERALVGEYRGYVVALWRADPTIDTDAIRVQLRSTAQHPVTFVRPPSPLGPLSASFSLAARTARLLVALGIDDIMALTDDYLPYSAVLNTDGQGLTAFLADTIGAVRRYDQARGAELLGTLRAFVRSGASPTRTARALHFHTNTILQRLERLDHVLGADWREDERLFRIGIAVRLDELREQLDGRIPNDMRTESGADRTTQR